MGNFMRLSRKYREICAGEAGMLPTTPTRNIPGLLAKGSQAPHMHKQEHHKTRTSIAEYRK